MNKQNLKIVIAYAAICLIWGTTWLAIKATLFSFTPLFSASLRFFFASIFIFLFAKSINIKLQLDKDSIKLYLYLALFSFTIPFGLVYWGQNAIPTGLASILFSTYPFFVILFNSRINLDDKNNIYQIIGSILGFFGITIIFAENVYFRFDNAFLSGMLAIIISSAMQALGAALIKKYGKNLHPLSLNFFSIFFSFFFMSIAVLFFEDIKKIRYDMTAVLATLYLSFFGTLITFTLYYWLMKKINLVLLSLSAFITPIIAIVVGIIFLDEKFTFFFLFGSAVSLVGILIANLPGIKKLAS